jgi:hypothetical protein
MPEDYALNLEEMKRMMANAMGTNLAGQSMAGPVATGQAYAQQIAGGVIPDSQVIAPGVSYSPEMAGGYTQADLDMIARGPAPVMPVAPTTGDVAIIDDQMPYAPPGVTQPTPWIPGQTSFPGIGNFDFLKGLDFSNLPDFSNIDIDSIMQNIPATTAPAQDPVNRIYDREPLSPPQQLRPPLTKPNLPKPMNFTGLPQAQSPAQGLDFGNIDIDVLRKQIAGSGINFTNLFGLPNQPDFSQFVTKKDLPSMIPQVPNDSNFSIENLNLPDFSQFVTQQDLPAFNPQDYRDDFLSIAREGINIPSYEQPDLSGFAKLKDIPQFDPSQLQEQIAQNQNLIAGIPKFNPQDYRDDFLSIAREGINIPQYQAPDLSGFAKLADIPSFDPVALKQDILSSLPQQAAPDLSSFVTQADINKAISGINMPSYQQPDLSAYDTRLADLEKTLLSLQQPAGYQGFSANQLNPRGFF